MSTKNPIFRKISLRRWYADQLSGSDQRDKSKTESSATCGRLVHLPTCDEIQKVLQTRRVENMMKAQNNQDRIKKKRKDREDAQNKHTPRPPPGKEEPKPSKRKTSTPRTPNFPKLNLEEWKDRTIKEYQLEIDQKTTDDGRQEVIGDICTGRQAKLLQKAEDNHGKLKERQEKEKEDTRLPIRRKHESTRSNSELHKMVILNAKPLVKNAKPESTMSKPRGKKWKLAMYLNSNK